MLNAYFIDSIQLKTLTGRDQWNKPTYSTVAVMGRVDWQTKLVRNLEGEQVVSAALVYLPKTVTPTHETRIIIDGVEHAVLNISRKADFSVSHWEVYIA